MAGRYGERYRGEPHGRDRQHHRDDRGFMDRAGDHVRSWLGDDEAARRRERDRHREQYAEHEHDDRPRYVGKMDRRGEYDPAWERHGGYGSERAGEGPREERDTRGWWGPTPEWHDESGAGASYRGYMGFSRSRNWEPYGSRDDERDVGAYDEEGRRTSGYQYPPASAPMTGAPTWHRGEYAGRGPKGYQRSDDRIREDVCDRLTDDPHIDASDIEVAVNRGEVTLSGTVRERDDKRRAEDLIERISGVREVHNTLRVHRPEPGTSPGSVLGVSPSPGPTGRTSTDINAPGTRR